MNNVKRKSQSISFWILHFCPDWWTSCWMGTAGERMIMLMLSKVVWETKSWRCCRQLCLDSDKCNFWVIFDFRFSLRPSSWSWRPTKLIRCWIGVYRNAPSCLLSTEPLQWPKKMAISLLGQRYVEYIGYLQCHWYNPRRKCQFDKKYNLFEPFDIQRNEEFGQKLPRQG